MKRRNANNRWKRLRPRRDDTETTQHYTARDYQALVESRSNNEGILRPKTGDLNLPSNLEDLGDERPTRGPNTVVLVIVLLALTFITIITYFVSEMPPKN